MGSGSRLKLKKMMIYHFQALKMQEVMSQKMIH